MKGFDDQYQLGRYADDVRHALRVLVEQNVIERLWDHDHRLWSSQPDEIMNRLGWLESPEAMRSHTVDIDRFCTELREEGYRQAMLLGMGGSSLAPEVFRKTFGVQEGWLDLAVLDSTDPQRILRETGWLNLEKTLFLVSTKSGGTVETVSLFKYFFSITADTLGWPEASRHFVAITDPGSSLAELAREYHFRTIIFNDPNLGGRYSALSHFGCVPARLGGMDLDRLLEEAVDEVRQSKSGIPPEANPGLFLGAVMGELARQGRDKITFFISPTLDSFGDWVEQLIAESTGKQGKGILPVVAEKPGEVSIYGPDRLFVFLHDTAREDFPGLSDALVRSGHPVIRFPVEHPYALGRQFFRWELATAIAGCIMNINPFDQPDVEAAKVLARRMVAEYMEQGLFPEERPALVDGQVGLFGKTRGNTLEESIKCFLGQKQVNDYLAIQAYLDTRQSVDHLLDQLRGRLRDMTGLATTLGYGPRFLHSTGQLHKGDAGNGLFLQITDRDQVDCPIPDRPESKNSSISFGVLKAAQARGDWEALRERNRRILRVDLSGTPEDGLEFLLGKIQ